MASRPRRQSTDDPTAAAMDAADDDMVEQQTTPDKFTYNIQEYVDDDEKYANFEMIHTLEPKDFTVDFVRTSGMADPLRITGNCRELDMKMPTSSGFSIANIRRIFGGDYKVQVVEVNTQEGLVMTVDEFTKHYKTPKAKREKIYNLLSLEFTHSKLNELVTAPQCVRDIDWVNRHVPKAYLRASTAESHFHPKVQHYCLLSVAGCYTDFHIDFGGTSVWYHVFKGEKIFWLVRPTEANVILYEEWLLMGEQQSTVFFADILADDRECVRVRLTAGQTFVIPSGWLHAVYTPEDSIVFGGNFLYDGATRMQLRVHRSELRTKINAKFRYPDFVGIHWYRAAAYAKECLGNDYIDGKVVTLHIQKTNAGEPLEDDALVPRVLQPGKRRFRAAHIDAVDMRDMQAVYDFLRDSINAPKPGRVPLCIGVANAKSMLQDLVAVLTYAKLPAEARRKMTADEGADESATYVDGVPDDDGDVSDAHDEDYTPGPSNGNDTHNDRESTTSRQQKKRAPRRSAKSVDKRRASMSTPKEEVIDAKMPRYEVVDDLVPLGKRSFESMLRRGTNMQKDDDKMSKLEAERLAQMRTAHAKRDALPMSSTGEDTSGATRLTASLPVAQPVCDMEVDAETTAPCVKPSPVPAPHCDPRRKSAAGGASSTHSTPVTAPASVPMSALRHQLPTTLRHQLPTTSDIVDPTVRVELTPLEELAEIAEAVRKNASTDDAVKTTPRKPLVDTPPQPPVDEAPAVNVDQWSAALSNVMIKLNEVIRHDAEGDVAK